MDLSNFKQVRNQTIWVTATGEEVAVKTMTMSHVQNTIIWLSNKQKSCDDLALGPMTIGNRKVNEWIEILRTELKYRENPKLVLTETPKPVKKEEVVSSVEQVILL